MRLAKACAEGCEDAWRRFLEKYRNRLYASALSLTRDGTSAEELVDLLIGDLYGAALKADGTRCSKLSFYNGRGTLESWLRATMARLYVDQYRVRRRFTTLDEAMPFLRKLYADESLPQSALDPRLEPAIEAALTELPPESRFILKAHFLDECTFAEIAMILGLHESTVSRRSARLIRELRRSVLRILRKQGMSAKAAEEALGFDVRQLSLDIRRFLIVAQPVRD